MQIIPLLLKELEQEAQTTRKMLKLIPDDKLDWQPHPKSMTMQQLSVHIAELPVWIAMAFTTSELDFAKFEYKPTPVNNAADISEVFEKNLAYGKASLTAASDEDLLPEWTMRNGEQIYSVMNKYEVVRHAYSQMIHHRAQLGVFLRLLDIPIPGSYGPSADERF